MILTDNQNQFKNQDSHYEKQSGGQCSRVGYLRAGNDGAVSIVVGGCESHDGLGAEFPVELSLTRIAEEWCLFQPCLFRLYLVQGLQGC